jgi:hypothetical protein
MSGRRVLETHANKTARGTVEFLKDAITPLLEKDALRVVRADSGFLDQALMGFLEQRGLS